MFTRSFPNSFPFHYNPFLNPVYQEKLQAGGKFTRKMKEKEKIAFVIQGLGIGGAEKFLVTVINHFVKNGYKAVLILLTENNGLLPELDNRVDVITLLKRSRLDLLITYKIRTVLKREGVSKVFCVNSYAFFLSKLAFLFNRSVRFFISLHSTIPFTRKYYIQNLIYFRAVTESDTIIYLCKNQQQYLKKKYYLPKATEYVIYNGIDPAYFNPDLFAGVDRASLRSKYGFIESDEVITLVARLQAEKRHTDAIDALSILHNKYNRFAHLFLVGSGELGYTGYLQKYIEENKLESFVHFAGSQSDVRPFYFMADIFTLTSNSETFSLSALEAMAFELPCSLTNVGGAAEMLIENVTGKLSQPENAGSIAESWNDLLINQRKRPEIRRHVIDQFSSERMLGQYLELVG